MNEIRKDNEPVVETQIRETKSGGASIVDFNYEKYAEVERKAVNTDGAVALGLGIASIIMDLIFSVVGIVLGIIGIVFALRGRRDPERRGVATAGLVCSVIGFVLGVLAILVSVILVSFVAGNILFNL